MDYISAKEAAEIWGVTSRYVTRLASAGRIDGAKIVGTSWMIPDDAPRPSDARKKASSVGSSDDDRFCLPVIIYTVHSRRQVEEEFSEEQKMLYSAFMAFEAGDLEKSRDLSEQLIGSTKNIFIRIGAYFNACYTYVILKEFDSAKRCYILFHRASADCVEYRELLEPIVHDFDAVFFDSSYFLQGVSFDFFKPFPPDILPYYHLLSVYSEMITGVQSTNRSCCTSHSMSCLDLENQGYFFPAMYMNWAVAGMYLKQKDVDMGEYHLKKAIDIALKHNTLLTLARILFVYGYVSEHVLSAYPPDVQERFMQMAELTRPKTSKELAFAKISSLFDGFSPNDYRLLSSLVADMPVDQIAMQENISVHAIRKRILSLRKKLGASSKKELVKICRKAMLMNSIDSTELFD